MQSHMRIFCLFMNQEVHNSAVRVFIAYFLCPLMPTLYFLLLPLLPLFFGQPINFNSGYVFIVIIFSLPVCYLSCYLIGLPYLYILKKNNLFYSDYILLGSAISGAVIQYLFGFFLVFILDSHREILPTIQELSFGAAFGLSVAIPFCIALKIPFIKSNKPVP